MTTKNIVTDYGASPNGQIITTTVTMSSSVNPTHLQVTGSPFVIGDVGKLIVVQDAGLLDPNANPPGHLFSTIFSFTNANNVVLADPCIRSVAGLSKKVEWGTDCTPKFMLFHADFVGLSGVQLDVPGNVGTGRYCLGVSGGTTGSSAGPFFGIGTLIVNGTNNPILSDMLGEAGLFLGGTVASVNTTYAFTNTVAAGQSQLVLKTAADASNYSANSWSLMTGLDPQGFGFPPNPQFVEWVFITSIHTGTTDGNGGDPSTITLQTPLKNSYKSTWPIWFTPLAGPAALYVVSSTWDCDQTYQGMTIINSFTVGNANGRTITFQNCIFPDFSANCSTTQTFNFDTCTTANLWEIDKINDVVNFTNCTLGSGGGGGFFFFSSSTNVLNVTNCNITNVGGTAKKSTFTGCTITTGFKVGPSAYGVADELTCDTCVFSPGIFDWTGLGEADLAGAGAYSMSNGIISRLKSAGTGEPPPWAIPGHYVYWAARNDANAVFKVLDITEDGTSIFIQTDQSGGFPAYTFNGSPISAGVQTLPCQKATFINCTGADEAIAMSGGPAGKPLNSYWNKAYTDNGKNEVVIPMKGTLVSVKLNVTTPYSGIHTPLLMTFGGPFYVSGLDVAASGWNPAFDMGTAGLRTILPGSVSGSTGNDNLGSAPGVIWLVDNQIQPAFNHDISAESSGVYPVYTLEIITNQGVFLGTNVVPLCLRLHA